MHVKHHVIGELICGCSMNWIMVCGRGCIIVCIMRSNVTQQVHFALFIVIPIYTTQHNKLTTTTVVRCQLQLFVQILDPNICMYQWNECC